MRSIRRVKKWLQRDAAPSGEELWDTLIEIKNIEGIVDALASRNKSSFSHFTFDNGKSMSRIQLSTSEYHAIRRWLLKRRRRELRKYEVQV